MASAQSLRSELELRDYLWVLRRRKFLILLVIAAVVLGTLAYTLLQPKVYEGRGALVVESGAANAILTPGATGGTAVSQAQVETEAEIMSSRPIQRQIEEILGYEPDVTIRTVEESPAILIRSRNESPEKAARDVTDFVETYVEVRRDAIAESLTNTAADVQSQVDELDVEVAAQKNRITEIELLLQTTPPDSDEFILLNTELDRLTVQTAPERVVVRQQVLQDKLDQINTTASINERGGNFTASGSAVPTTPVEPRPVRAGLIALAVGLLLAITVAFIRDYFDDSMRTKEDLDTATGGIPVLSLIPEVPSWRNRDETVLESVAHPHSATSEAYRSFRTSLEFAAIEHKIGIVHITSSTSGEGKTTTAANLAVTLASTGKRVVLVDCDLRRPRVHKFFGMENTIGFTSVLVGEIDAHDALQPVEGVPGLLIMPSGPRPPNPSELLSTKAAQALLETLGKFADNVVIDSPPLLPVADSSVLAGYSHATVLVVTAKSTSRRSLGRSLELLSQVNAPLEGILFNGVGHEATYGYGYGYDYTYAEDNSRGKGLRRNRARAYREHDGDS